MSKRTKVVLIALVWLAAAGLAALPVVWPPFRRDMETVDLLLMFGAGWLWHGIWVRNSARPSRILWLCAALGIMVVTQLLFSAALPLFPCVPQTSPTRPASAPT